MMHLAIDLAPPLQMSRVNVLLRFLLAGAVGVVTGVLGWPCGLLYLGVPVVSAVLLSQHRSERFLTRDARILARVYGWLMGFHAFMGLLTDRFPLDADREPVHYEGETTGTPTVGSAMLRILTSIPIAIVLALIAIGSALVWLVSASSILLAGRYPRACFELQYGVLKLQGQALAYHASLVDAYPRVTLATQQHAA